MSSSNFKTRGLFHFLTALDPCMLAVSFTPLCFVLVLLFCGLCFFCFSINISTCSCGDCISLKLQSY